MPEFSWSQLFTSNWEFLGFVTGVLSVALLIPTTFPRLQWTNWIASIVSAAVYLYLFFQWTLYGNALLQIPFLAISIAGAWKWRGQLLGIVRDVEEIPTTYGTSRVVAAATLIAVVATLPVYFVLAAAGDAAPLWDGLILTLSLAAIWLQLKKYVQTWYLWIAVDLVAVPLHFLLGRGATSLLYLLYLAMCFAGFATWRKEARDGQAAVAFVSPSGRLAVEGAPPRRG